MDTNSVNSLRGRRDNERAQFLPYFFDRRGKPVKNGPSALQPFLTDHLLVNFVPLTPEAAAGRLTTASGQRESATNRLGLFAAAGHWLAAVAPAPTQDTGAGEPRPDPHNSAKRA